MGPKLKLVFAVSLLLQLLYFSRGNRVGVAYGRDATNLPSPNRVGVQNAFKNTGIEITEGAHHSDLSTFQSQPYNIEFPRKGTNPNGGSWCVASKQAQKLDLQKALDWVCGPGKADCSAIQHGQKCFEPNNLVSHASFAFNDYYKKHGATAEACNFGGTGIQVSTNPSYDKCIYS
ncbi:hypothetical protein V6N13_005562 [Hibiscus sabdariffa]|uniref:X8 domain-containing protein n=1 Tax=Hibiscus sabdariffa TaxID=183260 RepID=A0ABR2ESX3_9ROSI